MIGWYASLQRASAKQRLWATCVLALFWIGALQQWHNLHDDLAVARWMAWITLGVAVLFTPAFLVVLLGGRVPRFLARSPESLRRGVPHIHSEIHREHQDRENDSRRF